MKNTKFKAAAMMMLTLILANVLITEFNVISTVGADYTIVQKAARDDDRKVYDLDLNQGFAINIKICS